ncbi:MAG: pca operon transcription factor PcaQ [Roseitalea porphyridii]|uniref:pca operon transcription factor PcaQ n=1 Tax=Roseitalea porphyridii TaxID=1852022 RepID=UPI0032D9595A
MENHRRIKLRHLKSFCEIVRLRSFKQAADALALTQPAISRTMAELEEMVGAPLLTRNRGGVALTAEGEVFLHFAQMGLNAIQQGMARLDRMKTGEPSGIRIGALPSVAAALLPRAVRSFAELAPGVAVTVQDGPHEFLVDRLRRGDLDVVVGRLGPPETMAGLTFTQLYLEHVALVVRPGHPLAGSADLARIAAFPVIYPPTSAAIRPLVDRLMIANGMAEPPRAIESVSGAFGRSLVMQSDAVWIISSGVVAQDLEAGRLVRLPVDTTLTAGPVGLMVRADEERPPSVQLFGRAVAAALQADKSGGSSATP